MRSSLQWIGVLCLLLAVPASLFAGEVTYPAGQVERPLTLPQGLWELGAGIESFNWAGRSDSDLYPVLSLRYGFTDNVEFYLLGIKYRFIHSNPFELAVKGRVVGYGYSSIDGATLQTEVGAEAKHRLHRRFALLYGLEDYYTYFSDAPDRTDLRLSVGGLFSLTEKLALELKGTYRRLEKFNESEARVLAVAFLYNVSPKFDIRLGAAFSDYSTTENDRYFAESYKQAYEISAYWRF
jgi:hypothetical protein